MHATFQIHKQRVSYEVGIDVMSLSKIESSIMPNRGKTAYLDAIFTQDKAYCEFPLSDPSDPLLYAEEPFNGKSGIYAYLPVILSCNWLWHFAWSIADPTSSVGVKLYKSIYQMRHKQSSGAKHAPGNGAKESRIDANHFIDSILASVELIESHSRRREWFEFCVELVLDDSLGNDGSEALLSRLSFHQSIAARLVACWCIRKTPSLWDTSVAADLWQSQPELSLDPGLMALVNLGILLWSRNLHRDSIQDFFKLVEARKPVLDIDHEEGIAILEGRVSLFREIQAKHE